MSCIPPGLNRADPEIARGLINIVHNAKPAVLTPDAVQKKRAAYIRRACGHPDEHSGNYSVEFARDRADLLKAFELVHQSYMECGYIDRQEGELRVRIFDLLPGSITIVAKNDDQVVGTISVVMDSRFGLPMEEAFSEEIKTLRRRGRRIAEVTGLSIRKSHRNSRLVFDMFQLLTLYLTSSPVDDVCVAVSPPQAAFYETVLLFERMGDVRSYSSKKNDPVVGLTLPLFNYFSRLESEYSGVPYESNLYAIFYSKNAIAEKMSMVSRRMREPLMPTDVLRYFLKEKTNLFSSLSESDRRILLQLYPDLEDDRGRKSRPTSAGIKRSGIPRIPGIGRKRPHRLEYRSNGSYPA